MPSKDAWITVAKAADAAAQEAEDAGDNRKAKQEKAVAKRAWAKALEAT